MPIEIFCCYAREDQQLLQELEAYLTPLKRQELITVWSDTDINAGEEWEKEITKHLNTAQIILLLVSPDFMVSEYCYSKEMRQAMQRHIQGEANVIPIILRPIYWQATPFGKLQALPKDAKPVKSWPYKEEALFNVAEGIRDVVEQLTTKLSVNASVTSAKIVEQPVTQFPVAIPASPIKRSKAEPRTLATARKRPEPAKPVPVSINKYQEFALLRTLIGHSKSVNSVAISPDGHTLVSGSDDKTIKVWDLLTGELLYSLRARGGEVRSVAITPDGQTLVSGHSTIVYTPEGKKLKERIKVWNLLTGELLRSLKGYPDRYAFSPDGQILAGGHSDATVKLWDMDTGKILRTLRGHSAGISCVAISPDGQTLAMVSWAIELWNLRAGKLLRKHEEDSLISSVIFSPDGQTLISGSSNPLIKVWNLNLDVLGILEGHSDSVNSIAISSNGHTIASGSYDNTIKIWGQ